MDKPYFATAAPIYVASFVIDAGGVSQLTFAVPYVPTLPGSMFYLQALAIESTQERCLDMAPSIRRSRAASLKLPSQLVVLSSESARNPRP